jgi:hypothetical protein
VRAVERLKDDGGEVVGVEVVKKGADLEKL